MEDELQKARVISDRMFKAHNERDFDLDWHKEKADQLSERWQSVHVQIDSRSVQRLFYSTNYSGCMQTMIRFLQFLCQCQTSGSGGHQQVSEALQRLLLES